MKRVYITRQLPQAAIEIIAPHAEIDIWEGELPPPRETLLQKIEGVDGLLCLLTDRIDGALLDRNPKLKVVSQMAVGYDNIDVPACTSRGVRVGNTPGVLTETTADLAFTLILATARRAIEADRYTRSGEWKTWSPMLLTGPDVHHATLGIIGMGRIGYEVARRAHGFEMTILYTGNRNHKGAENDFGARRVELDELLAQSDFISIHTPLNPATRNFIGAAEFAKMKSTAIFINTARGPVVDENAMFEALSTGQILAAGLDVFEVEPLPVSSPLIGLDNVVLLPHIGSASVATRTKMATLAAENLVAGISGLPLPNPVNQV